MSDFVLHYDILEGIAKSSNSLGRQADEYANNLTGRIANAITCVTGSSSGYLEDASYYVNQKVAQLQRKAQEFYDFAEQVTTLAETATRVDEEVQKLLAENQEEFLSHHESLRIDDWKADILNWLVGIKNKLPFLEVLGNILSAVVTIRESFRDSLKYWFYCEGGKYIVEHVAGIALYALMVTLFVVSLATFAAVVATAGGFVAICGVIGAGIAAVNAATNVQTSYRAAYTACNGDPTWARIYSKQNTLSQVIRETNFNNGTLNKLSYMGADLIDAIESLCAIVCLAHLFDQGILKLFQTKSFTSLKEGSFKISDFKANIKQSFTKTKISISNKYTDYKVNIKSLFGKEDTINDFVDLNKLDDVPENSLDDILPKGCLKSNGIKSLDEISDMLLKEGVDEKRISEILSTPKGNRPNPTTYLSKEYINSHLSYFQDGVTKIKSKAPIDTEGVGLGTFVMPKSVADEVIEQAGGDVSRLEKLLGLNPGDLGTSPVRVDIPNPQNIRVPSGNEAGAWPGYWTPGGYTKPGGVMEAVIDPVLKTEYIVTEDILGR